MTYTSYNPADYAATTERTPARFIVKCQDSAMSRLALVNEPVAVMGDQVATDIMEVTDDLARLSQGGR